MSGRDPASRARTSGAESAAAPWDTVLGLGTIDAAFDACGKTVAEVTDYLAERFGLPVDDPRLTDRLLRHEPPASLVITGVDRPQSPGALVREVLGDHLDVTLRWHGSDARGSGEKPPDDA